MLLLVAMAAAVLPASPAGSAVCRPPSAEEALEELLDVAADDSPLEDEAWRIADEQEARDAFETPETVQRIDELASANGLWFDCADRMYHPVSGPDPRVAIQEGQDPETLGAAPEEAPDPDDATAPEAAPAPGGSVGSGPATTPGGEGGSDRGADDTAGAAPEGRADAATPRGAAPAGGRGAAVETAGDGVDLPGPAPNGRGGAVALPADESPGDGTTAGFLALGGAALVAMVLGLNVGWSRGRRGSPRS